VIAAPDHHCIASLVIVTDAGDDVDRV